MSADGKKINGTKEVLEAAVAAERGVSEQKKQEIFEAYARVREELLSESADGPQEEQISETLDAGSQEMQTSDPTKTEPRARILTLAVLCRRASMAAAAIAVFGLLLFAVGRIAKRTAQSGEEAKNNADIETMIQSGEPTDYDTSAKLTSAVTQPGEHDDLRLMADLKFTELQDLSGDRIAVTADMILSPYSDAEWDGGAQALCLVTLQSIDLGDVNGAEGRHAPLTIRIDRIYHSTADFDRKENDIITTQDRSVWFATEGGYTLNHPQTEIPMTETGAQYIVTIAKFGDNASYSVTAHTIPINGQTRVVSGNYGPLVWGTVRIGSENVLVPREQLYERMSLGDDVISCSEELIRILFE